MDTPTSSRRRSLKSNSGHNYDNLIASYWRQHRRPATYLDDHDGAVGHRLEPLQLTNPRSIFSSGKEPSVARDESAITSPSSSTMPSTAIQVDDGSLVPPGHHDDDITVNRKKSPPPTPPRKDSLPPAPPPKDLVPTTAVSSTPKTSTSTDKSPFSFMSSTFAKFSQRRQRKPANNDNNHNHVKIMDASRQQEKQIQKNQNNPLESSNGSFELPTLSSSLSGTTTDKIKSFEVGPVHQPQKTSSSDSRVSTRSFTGSIGDSLESRQTNQLAQSSLDQTDSNSGSDNSSTGSSRAGIGKGSEDKSKGSGSSDSGGGSQTTKKQRPNIPRIVIPDGTSINLSTPPSTPQQGLLTQPSLRSSQMTPWPYNFLQINERPRLQRSTSFRVTNNNNKNTNDLQKGKHEGKDRRRSKDQSVQEQQRQHSKQQQQRQQAAGTSLESTRPHAEPHKHPQEQQQQSAAGGSGQRQQYPQEPGEMTAGTAGTAGTEEAPTPQSTHNEEHSYLPEFGIMGIPMGFRTESLSSNEDKHMWWDYDQNENALGGLFSRAFWNRRFSTRSALSNTLKHIATTFLGLLIIVAIALTALGRIRHRSQVSDSIPESLDGTVIEARIVVIKGLGELKRPRTEAGSTSPPPPPPSSEEEEMEQANLRAIKVVESTKIPVWTGPIYRECFREECELEAFGKQFFAFMNPESFAINLNNKNWPSLCNSCIEITQNQFVYKTKVRVLGDLLTCSGNPNASTVTTAINQIHPSSSSMPRSFSTSITIKPSPTTMTIVAPSSTSTAPRSRKILSNDSESSRDKNYDRHHRRPHHEKKRPRRIQQFERREAEPSPSKSLMSASTLVLAPVPTRTLDNSTTTTPPLPYLIIDAATFENLTRYDSRMVLRNMDSLQVQFRFVLCDD
ncbi:hypothetical protein BGZ83_001310 [Gryganskiella cystojenkinii]|nr:hypothetical protein BGZ83_001310 [Gryganskiella cystojenkinii]